METEIKTSKTITLILNEKEANWLHIHMQNPLHDVHPDDEWATDRIMRKLFFDATV